MPPLRHTLTAGLLATVLSGPPAYSQTFATPLPPGPGTVALPIPCGPMAAPVLMPVGAPTAAPVAVYHYPGSVPASCTPSLAALTDYGSNCTSPPACGPRLSVTAEFLYWFTQTSTLPPLVTAAAPGVPVPPGGALGTPATDVLFGGRPNPDGRAGGRFGLGYAVAEGAALEASFFFLADRTDRFAGRSVPGGVTLGRPAVFAPTGRPTALPVAGVAAFADTSLLGWEANYRRRLSKCDGSQLDLLAGYRYLHLGDRVQVFNTSTLPVAGIGDAGVALVSDAVRTRNNFHGPQVGVSYRCGLAGKCTLDLLAKIALGVTVAQADLDGSTSVGPVGVPVGQLVGPSNTVHDRTSYFAAVPEAGLTVGYEVTDGLRLTAGYTFLYWSTVRRAADQIDLTAGSGDRPAFRDVTGDYWAQGVRLGLEWRY